MENDQKRPYYVLTRDEVKEKMKKQIDEISEIFLISKSDATVLLMYLRWDSLHVSERLGENKQKLLTESAAVGPDTIEKLTVRDQEMYERYILRSYLEGNKVLEIKQCPARDCNYFIVFHQENNDDDDDDDEEDYSLNAVCLCGHIFCWRCMLESHRPVTCNNASDWLSRDLKNLLEESDKSSSLSWIENNTKPCPHCFCPVQDDGLLRWDQFVTCACSGRFCWKCLRSEEAHKTGLFGACVEPNLGSRAEPETSCLDHWEASQVSLEQASFDLKAFEESKIKNPTDLKEQDIKVIREGLMLIVQCRQFLKWSCVYDYLHTEYDMAKREYLRFLQENAAALVQSYSETIKEEIERARKLSCDNDKLFSDTSNIGNYFYHFIKTLRDGLAEVKAKSYNNYGGPYWLCDRCTYGNSWFQKACKMCCDATASNVDKLSDLSLN